MAQAPKSEAPGTGGESLVRARLEFMGFGVVENSKHDLGIDLFVMVRDKRRFQRPPLMMFQSKTESENGDSYFGSPETDGDGNVIGWWYAEGDATHFNDWVQHASPHILVLTNAGDEVSYWVHVTKDRVQSTGKGYKILVPVNQKLRDSKDELLAIAEASQVQPSFQGTHFHASAKAVAPGRVLRHALLTPRLIAPHPNKIAGLDLAPEEAIALVAAGRGQDFRRVAEASIASINDAGAQSKDWRWRMFDALERWVRDYDPEPLRLLALATCAPPTKAAKSPTAAKADEQSTDRRAAVAVAAAAAQSEIGNWDEAARLLDLAGDDLDPVDHAWVQMWKAIAATERGQFVDARGHAVEAMKAVLLDQDDPTATAIGASAASYLFKTSDEMLDDEPHEIDQTGETADSLDKASTVRTHREIVDLTRLLTLNDTAASWWRAQAVGSAVREYDDIAFRAWAGRKETDDVLESSTMQLRSVWVSALMAGDMAAAAGTAELWSTRIVRMSMARPTDCPADSDPDVVRALDALRHADRHAALELVGGRLWRDGDGNAILATLERARAEGWWTPSTARAHLALLTAAGDLLTEADADATVAQLLDMIENDEQFATRYGVTFSPRHFGLQALATVLPAASVGYQVDALKRVVHIAGLEGTELGPYLRGVVYPVLAAGADEALQTVAPTVMATSWVNDQDGWVFLDLLRQAGSEAADAEMAAALGGGDSRALVRQTDFAALSTEGSAAVIEAETESCEELAREAREQGPAIGGTGRHAARLAAANLHDGVQARWEALYELLAEERATAESKQPALEILLADWSRVPEQVRIKLRDVYVISGGFAAEPALSREERYLAVAVAIGHRLGVVTDDDLRERILAWLRNDTVRRTAAARLISLSGLDVPIDVYELLAADTDVAVRAEATAALLRSGADQPRALRIVERAVAEDGSWVAYRAAQELVSKRCPRNAATDAALVALRSHRSASVRSLALHAVERQTLT